MLNKVFTICQRLLKCCQIWSHCPTVWATQTAYPLYLDFFILQRLMEWIHFFFFFFFRLFLKFRKIGNCNLSNVRLIISVQMNQDLSKIGKGPFTLFFSSCFWTKWANQSIVLFFVQYFRRFVFADNCQLLFVKIDIDCRQMMCHCNHLYSGKKKVRIRKLIVI